MLLSDFIKHMEFSTEMKVILSNNTDMVAVMLLPEDASEAKENILYLTTDYARACRLSSGGFPGSLLCLCSGRQVQASETALLTAGNLILADPGDMTDLFLMRSQMSRILSREAMDKTEVLEQMIRSESMEECIRYGSDYLGCGCMVFDGNLHTVISHRLPEAYTDAFCRELIRRHQPFCEAPGCQSFNRKENSVYILEADCHLEERACHVLLCQFLAHEKTFGYVAAPLPGTAVTSVAIKRLSILASLLCKIFLSMEHDRHPYQDAEPFLFRMLQAEMEPETARREAARINWRLPGSLRIITAAFRHQECSAALLMAKLNAVVAALPDARGLIYMDCISVFCDAAHMELTKLDAVLEREGLMAGVSAVFSDIQKINVHYKQCISVLNLARDMGLSGRVFLFEHMTFYLLLSSPGVSADTLGQYIHPGLETLRAYDRENDTELLHTLSCYIRHMGDLNRTADILFIHRNTVKYRIQKIKDMLGMDLLHVETYQALLLSFKIMEFLTKP